MRLQRIGQGFDPPPLHSSSRCNIGRNVVQPRPVVAMRPFASLLSSRAPIVAAGALLWVGCSGGAISPEKARAQAVAEAAGGKLPGDALDRWLVASRETPTRSEASGLVSAWINVALLIDAVRKAAPLDDQATVDSVIMETAARTVVAEYFGARDARMPEITERQVDSVLDVDQARVFQQIVLRLKGKPDSNSVKALQQRALQLHAKLEKGANFTAAVKEFSDDSASRSTNGFLPALTAAQMGDRLAPVYNLRPDGISQIVASPVAPAFIILRRANRQESRAGVKAWLAPQLAHRADSIYVDSIAAARHIVVSADARLRTRSMAHEPVALVTGAPFATWKDGALAPAAVRNATLSLTPADRFALTDAPDTVVTQFLVGLARRDIILPIVVKEPLPTAAIRAKIEPAYRRVLDSLRAAVRRLPASLSPADAAVMQIDSVLAQRAPFLPLPGALAAVLRARGPVTVNQQVLDAIARGVTPRWQVVHKDDSAQRRNTPALQRAPAGAPTPGAPPQP